MDRPAEKNIKSGVRIGRWIGGIALFLFGSIIMGSVQASLYGMLGTSIGKEEGVELNIFGLRVELDLFDLAIELPGIGRIGAGQTLPLSTQFVSIEI